MKVEKRLGDMGRAMSNADYIGVYIPQEEYVVG